MKTASQSIAGYSLIEMAAVIVLMVIISGLSLQAIMSSTDLFFTATRDYLEVYQESKTALEKIVRELRDCNNQYITFTSQTEIIFDKKIYHGTPLDPDVKAIIFHLDGTDLKRLSDVGDFVLASHVTGFSATTDLNNVITLDITSGARGSSIHLRTAVWARQPIIGYE